MASHGIAALIASHQASRCVAYLNLLLDPKERQKLDAGQADLGKRLRKRLGLANARNRLLELHACRRGAHVLQK